MADTELTFMTSEWIDGAYFNSSEDRFALIPSRSEEPLELQAIVEALIRRHAETQDLDAKNDIIAELMDLHRQGLILWPLGALWDRSALGEVNEQRFARSVEDHDPDLFGVRSTILKTEHFEKAKWSSREKANRSFALWKFVAALHFAIEGVEGIESLQEIHLLKMAEVLRVNGRWKPWVQSWTKKNIRHLARLLGEMRGDPLFALAVRQDLRQAKVSPRLSDLLRHAPHLQFIEEQYELWIDRQNVLTKGNYRDGLRLLLTYLASLPTDPARNPLDLLTEPVLRPLLDFAKTFFAPTARINAVYKIQAFAKHLSDESTACGGNRLELGFRDVDLERFKASQQLATASSAHSDVRARPMPPRYHQMLREIICENDFAWPRSLEKSGKPRHWITWFDPETGIPKPVFCEVLPRMLLAHLDLPLRNVQIRRLDSGEGDSRMWDPESGRWKPSTSTHGGYWERVGAKNPRRGVFREIQTLTGQITGFWVNSNKTQDGRELFGENSGYEIPWQHEEALRNLAALRAWQEKYNPVEGPLEHEDLPANTFDDDPSRLVKTMLPARFYLFRYPNNSGPRGNETPVRYPLFYQFFHDALAELERRLNEEEPDFPIRIITKWAGDSPKAAIFTIHGMRSANLTALYMAGVPIEILSKVVAGHATILMTLKYTKFEPVHVNEILTKARMQALETARNDFPDLLRGASLEEAMQMTARVSDDGIRQMKSAYGEPGLWSRFDIGICPNGGTLCDIGGPVVTRRKDKGKDKSKHSRVPGGARNCVRCRFFVTGLPFLIPLWAHANAVFAKLDRVARKMEATRTEIDRLKGERHQLNSAGEEAPYGLGAKIRLLDETWSSDAVIRDQALADAESTMLLIEKIRHIAGNADGESKLPMLLSDEKFPDVVGRESTRFELVDSVVQASRWFPSIADSNLEMERDRSLDKILYQNGYAPIGMAPLGEEERRRAADALAALLLIELKATETQNLIDGKKTLAEYGGLQERMEATARKAIGRPLDRLALPKPNNPPIIEAAAE
ncbi:VPA1269 family protein [Bradyrhizobium sp. USDA 10063]